MYLTKQLEVLFQSLLYPQHNNLKRGTLVLQSTPLVTLKGPLKMLCYKRSLLYPESLVSVVLQMFFSYNNLFILHPGCLVSFLMLVKASFLFKNGRFYTHNNIHDTITYSVECVLYSTITYLLMVHVRVENANLFKQFILF